VTAFVLTIVAAIVALLGWPFVRPSLGRMWLGAVVAGATGLAAVATIFEPQVDGVEQDVLRLFALVLAVCGGAVVTTAAFDAIDASGRTDGTDRIVRAGEVLRGGAWIGALERLAIFATLAARWPEGIAVVLAVKGLGRYPELRHQETADGTSRPNASGAAERFIIGTLVSMSWTAMCAYLAFAPYVLDLPR